MSKQWMKLAVLGLAAMAATSCRAKAAGDATNVVMLAPSDVASATRETIGEGVVVSGTLAPYHVADVRAQAPGTLVNLRVDRGSKVSAGQVMAVIQAEGIRSQAAGAKAAVAAAQAGLAVGTKNYESAKKLAAAGAMSDIDLQQARAGYEAAVAQLAAARAGEAAADEQARRANVVAPFDGDVSARTVNEGEAVAVGTVLLTVVDPGILELNGTVPVEQAVGLRPGMPVEFTLDGYANRVFKGSVARVEPVASAATRQVGVYVRLPNADGAVVGGLYAVGRIITGKDHQGTVVPLTALRGAGQDAYVWAIRNGKATKQNVTVGARDERRGWVEILTGVNAGETIVAAPGDLADGAVVRIAATGGVSPAERGTATAAPAQGR